MFLRMGSLGERQLLLEGRYASLPYLLCGQPSIERLHRCDPWKSKSVEVLLWLSATSDGSWKSELKREVCCDVTSAVVAQAQCSWSVPVIDWTQ